MSHPQFRQHITLTAWNQIRDRTWADQHARAALAVQAARHIGLDVFEREYVILYDYEDDEHLGAVLCLDAVHRDDLLEVLRHRQHDPRRTPSDPT